MSSNACKAKRLAFWGYASIAVLLILQLSGVISISYWIIFWPVSVTLIVLAIVLVFAQPLVVIAASLVFIGIKLL